MTPLSPDRYALELTISRSTRDFLNRLQELLSHQIPSGDLAEVLDRGLAIAVAELEKRKYGATDRPRKSRGSKNRRYIPNHVRRAVRERDGGRCTFVCDGRRCGETKRLEFDHIVGVGQGGETTVANVRLLCRAHNQHVAERTYGAQFMQGKREEARAAQVAARERAEEERRITEARAAEAARVVDEMRAAEAGAAEASRIADETRAADEARAAAATRVKETVETIASGLRRLGYRAQEARDATAFAVESAPDASLEALFRNALRWFASKGTTVRFESGAAEGEAASQQHAAS